MQAARCSDDSISIFPRFQVKFYVGEEGLIPVEAAAVPKDATRAGTRSRGGTRTSYTYSGPTSKVEERFAKGWNANRGRGGYELAKLKLLMSKRPINSRALGNRGFK